MAALGEMSLLQHGGIVALLPDSRPPWRKFLFGVGTQSLCLAALLLWQLFFRPYAPDFPRRSYEAIDLIESRPSIHPAPLRAPLHAPVKVAVSAPVLAVPAPVLKVAPDTRSQPHAVDAPVPAKLSFAPKPMVVPAVRSVLPKPAVNTNVFSASGSAKPTLDRTPTKVQTGGFGDPNGVPSRTEKTTAANIARSGAFDLPTGSGLGNGSALSKGAKGVVANAGFGGESGAGRVGSSGSRAVSVHNAGFAAPAAQKTQNRQAPTDPAQTVVPAEILSKPVPTYTEEARKLHIQGEVLLEVVLEASGGIHVLRVVRGLGHGLDESAVQAAGQIRFKPELRDGHPSDSRVVLHIMFQLA